MQKGMKVKDNKQMKFPDKCFFKWEHNNNWETIITRIYLSPTWVMTMWQSLPVLFNMTISRVYSDHLQYGYNRTLAIQENTE